MNNTVPHNGNSLKIIGLKITDKGRFGNLNIPLFESLPSNTKLIIKGENLTSHPDLEDFLFRMSASKIVCDIRINWTSFLEQYERLKKWTEQKLINEVGVIINEHVFCETIDRLCDLENTAIYTVLGTNESVFRQLMGRNLKLIILGYRQCDNQPNKENINWTKNNLFSIFSGFKTVYISNIAFRQMRLTSGVEFHVIKDEELFIDLPNNQFAVSDISPKEEKRTINSTYIDDLFEQIRKEI